MWQKDVSRERDDYSPSSDGQERLGFLNPYFFRQRLPPAVHHVKHASEAFCELGLLAGRHEVIRQSFSQAIPVSDLEVEQVRGEEFVQGVVVLSPPARQL